MKLQKADRGSSQMTNIKGKTPLNVYLLLGIVLIGAFLVGVFSELIEGILSEPLQTPDLWLLNHPYINIGNIIIAEPSSTAIVYLLTILTLLVGIYFMRTQNALVYNIYQ